MEKHADILKILDEAGHEAFKDSNVLKKLSAFYEWSEYNNPSCGSAAAALEIVTSRVLGDDIEEETPKLLEKLATMTADQRTYPDRAWHHSVCHNFESYGRRWKDDKRTFLRDPRFFPAATILINKAAESPHEGCFSRIVDPIVKYNIDRMLIEGMTEEFSFKPASLSLKNVRTAQSKYNELWTTFCKSDTPKEFLETIGQNPVYVSSPNTIIELTNLIDQNVGSEPAQKFLEKSLELSDEGDWKELKNIAPEQFLETIKTAGNSLRNKQENHITSGVFSDVEGTLLVEGQLNKDLADYLTFLKKEKNVAVTIFTGGDTEKLTSDLAKQGLDAELLPVRKKEEFFGQCLDVLVDDTSTISQPFSAKTFIYPYQFNKGEIPQNLKDKYGTPPKPVPESVVVQAQETSLSGKFETQSAPQPEQKLTATDKSPKDEVKKSGWRKLLPW